MNNKKAAMFGLEARALKKQSSELFLARFRRLSFMLVEGQQASGNNCGVSLKQLPYKVKFGAMFGLDARIALAIFGALSVISGAALYSAIQQSKVVAIVSELNEVSKAIESYMLDVGEDLEQDSVSTAAKNMVSLTVSTKTGWNGPYLSYPVFRADDALTHNEYTAVQATTRTTVTWPEPSDNSTNCTTGAGCYYWVSFAYVPNDLAKAVDEYVDGTANRYEGKIRLVYPSNNTSSPTSHLYMQSVPVLAR